MPVQCDRSAKRWRCNSQGCSMRKAKSSRGTTGSDSKKKKTTVMVEECRWSLLLMPSFVRRFASDVVQTISQDFLAERSVDQQKVVVTVPLVFLKECFEVVSLTLQERVQQKRRSLSASLCRGGKRNTAGTTATTGRSPNPCCCRRQCLQF